MLIFDWIRRKAAESFAAGIVDGARQAGVIDPAAPGTPQEQAALWLTAGELKLLPPAAPDVPARDLSPEPETRPRRRTTQAAAGS